MNETVEALGRIGLVPVVKINRASDAVPLADALVAGGLPCAEVTFRTDAAEESIALMVGAHPDMVVGAGTVLTPSQADRALAAGAKFIVSPGFNPDVVDHCLEVGAIVMPGINSPSGVEQCLARGLEVIKFFPAEPSGGLPFINALAGPYAGVKFMPTGGINPANLASYTTNSHIFACGGTWMVKEALLDAGDFAEVERLCREAVDTMLALRLEQVCVSAENGADVERVQRVASLLGLGAGGGIVTGHENAVTVSTIDLRRAVFHLRRRGLGIGEARGDTARLATTVAGFAVNLVQR